MSVFVKEEEMVVLHVLPVWGYRICDTVTFQKQNEKLQPDELFQQYDFRKYTAVSHSSDST